jgi:hypothetical protein
MSDFRKSREASWRRYLRSAVRQSAMSRAQKDVTMGVLNLWLHHRNGLKGVIHPGRERLAKGAKVSVRTVASTLKALRDAGVLKASKHAYGEGQKPTEYTMNTLALIVHCGGELPEWVAAELVQVANKPTPGENEKRTLRNGKLHTTGVQKLHTVLNDVWNGEKGLSHG